MPSVVASVATRPHLPKADYCPWLGVFSRICDFWDEYISITGEFTASREIYTEVFVRFARKNPIWLVALTYGPWIKCDMERLMGWIRYIYFGCSDSLLWHTSPRVKFYSNTPSRILHWAFVPSGANNSLGCTKRQIVLNLLLLSQSAGLSLQGYYLKR